MDKKIVRILDVNINRTAEALRVCEEVVRFYVDSKTYMAQLKKVRHDVHTAVSCLPLSYKKIIAERDSEYDVGKDMVIHAKKSVRCEELFIRNIKRAQESTRVLEEFSKTVSRRASNKFQALRFALYQLEKKVLLKFEEA